MRVVGPVGSELKLHGKTGSNTESKVDTKQLTPEFGHVFIDLLAGHHVHRLHDHEDPSHADSEWYEQEVVEGGNGELPTRQFDHIWI